MKKIKSIALFVSLIVAALIFSADNTKASGGDDTCYINAYMKGSGEVCFICTLSSSTNPCTTSCGSEVCWTGPGETE